jgi:hypothetical protein
MTSWLPSASAARTAKAASFRFAAGGERRSRYRADGTEGPRTTKSFVTRDAANEWRIAQIHSINRGTSVPPDKMTVAGWMKYWLEEIVIPPNTRFKTHELYRWASEHIESELGNVLLQKLSQPQVQTVLNRKAKTLSAKSTKHIRDTLRAALNVAKDHGIIASNPAEKARPPKIEERHERIFSKEEALRFLAAIKGHPLEGAFLIELIFGLRRGEVLGLKPEDLDWENETRIEAGGSRLGERDLRNTSAASVGSSARGEEGRILGWATQSDAQRAEAAVD